MYVKLHTYCINEIACYDKSYLNTIYNVKTMADKSVNRSKYLNKKKYSGNKPRAKEDAAKRAAQIAKAEKESLKIKLGDNWDRYNEGAGPSIDSAKDYSHLSKTPINKAEYFQFKREQDIFNDAVKTNSDFDKLFNLDLNLISTGLGAISFCKRCDLSEELFTSEELHAFAKTADDYFVKYNEYVGENRKGTE